MTKTLRKRIMLIMMLLLSITFISIIIAINVWIRANNRAQADNSLRFLLQQEMKPDIPIADNKPSKKPGNKPNSSEIENSLNKNTPPNMDTLPNNAPNDRLQSPSDSKFPLLQEYDERHLEILTSHFIIAQYSTDKQLIEIENTLSDRYTDAEIQQYCEEIFIKDKSSGTVGQLRYILHENTDGFIIAFIDHAAAERSDKNLLTISVILGIVGLIIFALLSYFISGLMVRPVEEAFDKQKQFISDASHELKTPIAVILSNSELIEDQIGSNKQLSYIKKECDRMHHLVTSLLTLTRLEQTPYEHMEKVNFCLSDAMLERILPLESIAFEKGILMSENIAPDIFFYGIKEQLQQVAGILIDNALSHTEASGKINITLQKTTSLIVFTVSNTGEAIPEDEREKLFERFYRVDKARNRANGHYGLGLSIASTIINNHKGNINVECNDGITSFIITLKQAEK